MRELSNRLTRHAVDVRVLAGENRGTAWGADGVRGEDARHQSAFAREAIEVWSLVDPGPVGANGVRRMVVGHDEMMFGRLCRGLCAATPMDTTASAAATAATTRRFDSIRTNQNLSRKPPRALVPPALTFNELNSRQAARRTWVTRAQRPKFYVPPSVVR
jgi:hypothetical protein